MGSLTVIVAMVVLAVTSTLASPTPNSFNAPSTSGTCSDTNNRCVGDITYWDGGLGACGWTVDSTTQNQIALPVAFMGTQSNGNPYCGRSVTLYSPLTGVAAQATVGDKCMGCVDRNIDLTQQLFGQLTDGNFGVGREHNVQWWFN